MMRLHPALRRALAGFHQEPLPADVPPELPLLTDVRARLGTAGAFRGVDTLFVQHHLGPFVPRLEAMGEDGLDRARSWLVDIPYSTSAHVRSVLTTRGFPPAQVTRAFEDPLAPYGDAQLARVLDMVERLAERPRARPLLVVDDGAYFVRVLAKAGASRPTLLRAFRGAAVVEQTTRGHRYLEGEGRRVVRECALRVVSIARCRTKLGFESPFIGAAVARAMVGTVGWDRVAALNRVAVIGYGAVGRATVRRLLDVAPGARIDIIDTARRARWRARAAGTRCRPRPALDPAGGYELVVGCTGYGSFALDDRRLLADGALLASGSSAAVEFNRAGFIELADRLPDDEIEVLDRDDTLRAGIHATIRLAHEGGTFAFLNAGFPVNFDGRLECLPVRAIQATHCLLYAAGVQALRSASPGLQPIDRATDRLIGRRALEHL